MQANRWAAALLLAFPASLVLDGIKAVREDPLAGEVSVRLGLLGGALIAALGLWNRRAWSYWLAVVVNALPATVSQFLGLWWDATEHDSLLRLTHATLVNAAPCVSLALLFQRDCRALARPPGESHWGRAVAVAATLEVALMALFVLGGSRGGKSWFEPGVEQSWFRTARSVSQRPGEVLLAAISPRLCCSGFLHTVVYTDAMGPPGFGLNPGGIPILAVANAVPLAGAGLGCVGVWRLLRGARRGRARAEISA